MIQAGVEGGERIVVSDPAPAIQGMRIEAIGDSELRRQIVEQAEGEKETR